MPRRAVANLCLLAALAGCGGADEPDTSAADELGRAVQETRQAGTLTFRTEFRASGGPDIRFDAEGRADFRSGRERYRLTVIALGRVPEGTETVVFAEEGNPRSPVPAGVIDSLRTLATDAAKVMRAGSGSVGGVPCARYTARLDTAKIAERADLGRHTDDAAVGDAPVSVCIDERDLLRQLTVEFAMPGTSATLRAFSVLADHGEAAPLSARSVGVDE